MRLVAMKKPPAALRLALFYGPDQGMARERATQRHAHPLHPGVPVAGRRLPVDVNITRVGVRSLTLAFRFRRGDTIDENGVGPMPNHR